MINQHTRWRKGPAEARGRTAAIAAVALGGLLMISTTGCSGIDRADASPTDHQATPSSALPSTSAVPSKPRKAPTSGPPSSSARPGTHTTSNSPAAPSQTAAPKKPAHGSIHKVVPSRTMHTAKPVGLDKKSGSFGSGVTAKVVGIRQQYVKAKLPGQLSGASVVFDLAIKNGSRQSLDLNATTVTVTDAKGDPAPEITATTPATPLPNLLRAGETASATYVFIVPKADRNPVDIDVTINSNLKVVVFHGDAG